MNRSVTILLSVLLGACASDRGRPEAASEAPGPDVSADAAPGPGDVGDDAVGGDAGGEDADVVDDDALSLPDAPPGPRKAASGWDIDGDGKADRLVFSRAGGQWRGVGSQVGEVVAAFGWLNVEPLCGDFDGDGVSDLAVVHPAVARWVLRSLRRGGATVEAEFGYAPSQPVPADYDGDGITDLAVYNPVVATWYVFGTVGGFREEVIGEPHERAVPADYDGDGRADLATFSPSTGRWLIEGTRDGRRELRPGWTGREPVSADWEADGTHNANFGGRPRWRYSDHDGAAFGTNFFVVAFFANGDPPQPRQIFDGAVGQE